MDNKRLNSRKRHIAPALIGQGLGMVTGLVQGEIANKKAKELEEDRLQMYWQNKELQDANILDEYDTTGMTGVEYYANGGRLNKGVNPSKFTSTGGDLVPIAEGVDAVVGNTHGEKTIDGQYGVQLQQNGQPVAEVENGEVIADDSAVYSNRLMYDKNNSYADKMIQLSAKRNKLDKQLDGTIPTRKRNGLERKLASLNMAEEALYLDQEKAKIAEGNAELGKFADGGKLPKSYNPSLSSNKDFQSWYKNNTLEGKNNIPYSDKLDYDYLSFFMNGENSNNKNNINNHFPDTYKRTNHETFSNESIYSTPENPGGEWKGKNFNPKGKFKFANGGFIPSLDELLGDNYNSDLISKSGYSSNIIGENEISGVEDPLAALEKKKKADALTGAFASFGDNITNAIINQQSPNVPKPILAAAPRLNTRVNVNPRVAGIRDAVGSTVDNIQRNTSSSQVARANMADIRLRGAKALSDVYGEKENIETSLKNQQEQLRANTANTNANTLNQFATANAQNQAGKLRRISDNVNNLADDFTKKQERKDLENQSDEDLLNQLLNDDTGEKKRTAKKSPYIMERLKRAGLLDLIKT